MLHLDIGEIKTWDKMDNGTLRVLSTIARTGWLKYYHIDNTENESNTYWEYVSPEVLFSDRHLKSLQGSTVTLNHPPIKKVTTDNWSEYAVGMSSTQIIPNKEKGTLDVVSLIGSQVGIDAILKEGMRGISEGYYAPTKLRNDSSNNGLKLDQIYREANHYAICNNPRAGEIAKLHIDSIDEPIVYQIDWDEKNDTQYFMLDKPLYKKEKPWQILNVTL